MSDVRKTARVQVLISEELFRAGARPKDIDAMGMVLASNAVNGGAPIDNASYRSGTVEGIRALERSSSPDTWVKRARAIANGTALRGMNISVMRVGTTDFLVMYPMSQKDHVHVILSVRAKQRAPLRVVEQELSGMGASFAHFPDGSPGHVNFFSR